MASQNLDQSLTLKILPSMTQTYVMQQADLLQMSDFDFHKLISELEKDPLFEKLYHQEKLIRYRRYADTDISALSSDIEKYPLSGGSYPDIESVIAKYPDILDAIRRLGNEKFKKYFLFPQDNFSLEVIATECNISIKEIHTINNLVNEMSILSTFYHPPDSGSHMLSYTCLGSIRHDRDGFIITYLSPVYARGRYVIDYEKIEQLIKRPALVKKDAKKIRILLRKLELINNRKNVLQNILSILINKQLLFLKSGKHDNLLPFSQKELAREISVAPSSVSRTMRMKSIITPWDEEIPLKNLLPNLHMFKKELVKRMLETEPTLKSDEMIRKKIRDNIGAHISRRSISALRRELGINLKGNG